MQVELLVAAGRVAERRGWADAIVASVDELSEQAPLGPPLMVVAERRVEGRDAQMIAGLSGAGRAVALIAGAGVADDAARWLPPGCMDHQDHAAEPEASQPEEPESFAPYLTSLSGTGPGLFLAADTPDNRARDAYSRGINFAESGQWASAKASYEEAIRHGGIHGGAAAYNLGVHAAESGRIDEALAWYEQARSLAEPYVRIQATVNAANQHSNRGNRQRARTLYDEAISSPFPDQVELAQWNLSLMLAEVGDWGGAEPLMRVFVDHPGRRGAEACYNVGQCRWMLGDPHGARPWFQRAMAKGDPEITAVAAQSLSEL